MNVEQGHVVTWEPEGYWARALRRHLPSSVRIWEVLDLWENPPDCSPEILRVPCFDVLTDHAPHVDRTAAWCRLWFDPRRPRQTLAVSPMRSASVQTELRTAGAALVWTDVWELPAIARYIVRFCEKHAMRDLSLEQQIWKNLPWKA